MLRRGLVRYPINNKKVTADTIVHCRGKGFKAVGLLGCLRMGCWLWAMTVRLYCSWTLGPACCLRRFCTREQKKVSLTFYSMCLGDRAAFQ